MRVTSMRKETLLTFAHPIKRLWENSQFPVSSPERNKGVYFVSNDLIFLQLPEGLVSVLYGRDC